MEAFCPTPADTLKNKIVEPRVWMISLDDSTGRRNNGEIPVTAMLRSLCYRNTSLLKVSAMSLVDGRGNFLARSLTVPETILNPSSVKQHIYG